MASLARLKINIVRSLPFTSTISRYFKALYYAKGADRKSYSQHGEDVFILKTLQEAFPGESYNYIDVGAFHPVLLSNTYLLYRKGMRGITVEPNKELNHLHQQFRKGDIQLAVACSNYDGIATFFVEETFPALSSLNGAKGKPGTKAQYVPVFSLDTIFKGVGDKKVHFLSVDVEGFDYEVLEGGLAVLAHTFLVCVECNSDEEAEKISHFMASCGFSVLNRFACNLIFKNERFKKDA